MAGLSDGCCGLRPSWELFTPGCSSQPGGAWSMRPKGSFPRRTRDICSSTCSSLIRLPSNGPKSSCRKSPRSPKRFSALLTPCRSRARRFSCQRTGRTWVRCSWCWNPSMKGKATSSTMKPSPKRCSQRCAKEIEGAIVAAFRAPPMRGLGNAGGFQLQTEQYGYFDLARAAEEHRRAGPAAQHRSAIRRRVHAVSFCHPGALRRHQPDQGRGSADPHARRLHDAQRLHGGTLRQPVQSVRSHLAGAGRGGPGISHDGRHAQAVPSANDPGADGPDGFRCLGSEIRPHPSW